MLTNTRYFSEAAINYKKNGGKYTTAPINSKDWVEFWKLQRERCLKGYSVGGTKITGRHYYFLNFTRMEVVVKSKKGRSGDAPMDFPKFLEVQYNWWWAKEIAKSGIEQDDFEKLGLIWKPKQLDGGHHISCAKTRGCGFSYMEAADGTYNYNFIPDSKSFFFAAKDPYLVGLDGILLKCWRNLNWLNQETDGYWKKSRQGAGADTEMSKIAQVLVNGEPKGFKSKIGGVIIPSHDPDKVRGGRGLKLSFEEAGSFGNLKKTLQVAIPLVEQGGIVRGQISVFGTGGEEGLDIEGLESVFYEPEQWNMVTFDNVWEEEGISSDIGFFVPSFVCTDGYIDEDGNPDIEEAKGFWNTERALKKKGKDFKNLDRMIAERPFTPSECFKRIHNNVFQNAAYFIGEQINNIQNNKEVQKNIQHGSLMKTNDGYEFLIRTDLKPVDYYPHKNDDEIEGCFTIYEPPQKDVSGLIPQFLYYGVCDPFAIDDAIDRTSLGVYYIVKQPSFDYGDGNKIVAKYVGRPNFVQKFYEKVLYLTEYYRATCQSEIAGGGQGLLDYFKSRNKLHLCEYEPDHILHGKEMDKNTRNRSYFMRMPEEIKKIGLLYLAEWLCQERGTTGDGRAILNVHKIYDLGLLQELAKFNPDPKKNFDRISAMLLAMYMFKEKEHLTLKETKKSKSDFFTRNLFSNNPSKNSGHILMI